MKYVLIGLLLVGCTRKQELTRDQKEYLNSLKLDEKVFMNSCLEQGNHSFAGCMSALSEWKKDNIIEVKQ